MAKIFARGENPRRQAPALVRAWRENGWREVGLVDPDACGQLGAGQGSLAGLTRWMRRRLLGAGGLDLLDSNFVLALALALSAAAA